MPEYKFYSVLWNRMTDTKEDPPPYKAAIKHIPEKKGAAYRLYLHFKHKYVVGFPGIKSTSVLDHSLQYHSRHTPKFSIKPGNIPIEEVIEPFNPKEILTIVLENDELEVLKLYATLYTSHRYWNNAFFMPKPFFLSHWYNPSCVRRFTGELTKLQIENPFITLLVITAKKCLRGCILDIHHFGKPEKPSKYTLHVKFRASDLRHNRTLFNPNDGLVRTYSFRSPAIRSTLSENDKPLNTETRCRYGSKTSDFILKCPNLDLLRKIQKRYMSPEIVNGWQHYSLAIVSVHPESMVSIKEHEGVKTVTAEFSGSDILDYPYIVFSNPKSSK